jgi:hypothetical protein
MSGKPKDDNLRSTVAAQGGRVAALEERTRQIQEETSAINTNIAVLTAKLPNGWKAPQVIVAIVATVVAALSCFAALGTLTYNIRKVDKLTGLITGKGGINTSLALQAEREGRFESALRLLTAAVAPQLVHELDKALERSVATAELQGPKGVSAVVASFSDQVRILRDANAPASQSFFSNSASTLERVASKYASIGPDVHPAIELLAAYHSEVVRPSNLAIVFSPGSKRAITTEDLAKLPGEKDSFLKGFKVYMVSRSLTADSGVDVHGNQGAILFNMGDGDAIIASSSGGVPGRERRIDGLLIVTPSQTLDGFVWQNVVFVNARISYRGGPVTLKNVRFVNCTFDTLSKIGQPILNYAINLQPELILTGSRA